MSIKNALILVLVMACQLVGLGIYTNYVLKDVLVQAVNKETTSTINSTTNDVKTKIDNNFKKINELHSKIDTALPIKTDQRNEIVKDSVCVPAGYTLIKIDNLTRRQKKRLQIN